MEPRSRTRGGRWRRSRPHHQERSPSARSERRERSRPRDLHRKRAPTPRRPRSPKRHRERSRSRRRRHQSEPPLVRRPSVTPQRGARPVTLPPPAPPRSDSRSADSRDSASAPPPGPRILSCGRYDSSTPRPKRRVHVIADSLLKHIDGKIIKRVHDEGPRNLILTIGVHEGKEALDLSCPRPLDDYDHFIFCSAGNGMWKPLDKKAWKKLVNNINSLDPAKVRVVLVGSDEIWRKKFGLGPPNEAFYPEVKKLLEQKGIRFAQITDFMEEIKYCDRAGHVAPEEYDRFAEKLLKSFQDIIDVEAVRCEEACDAGAAATQQRPRRSSSSSGSSSGSSNGSSSAAGSERSIILNPKTDKKNSPSIARSATYICPAGPISKITVRAASTRVSWRRPRC